ncbi:MAG: TonB-dependent receptor, partial [Bacteroidota bacterium]
MFFIFLADVCVAGTTDTTSMDRDLPEVVISVNRVEQKRDELPQQVLSIRSGFIERENPATVADALHVTGQIFVQESQQGGGSPVLRGFEASRVLLVVDDVRLNNLIYRAGHLQNIITLDPFYLERVETVFGPSSTIYGSDALGGVIHMRSLQPIFSPDEKTHMKGSGLLRFTTATAERTAATRIEFSSGRWASVTSLGLNSFGDVRMGKQEGSADTVWGLRNYYVETFDGMDSLVKSSDPYLQKRSGYDQLDIMQRFRYKAGSRDVIGFNFQFSTSTEIPRYDRLTEPTSSGLKFAEWEYGPQKRLLASI